MAKRTPAQVYADLIAAGASPDAALTLTEIAGAESGWDDTALGDVSLENNTWGPSEGFFQIRTLKGQTGTGGVRDIAALAGDDAAQAKAALSISKGGTDFSPWSTFNNRKYLQFASQVQASLAGTSGLPAPSTSSAGAVMPALFGLPSVSSTAAGVRSIAIESIVALLGLGLVALGVAHFTAPAAKKTLAAGRKVAKVAGEAALL